MLCKGSIREVWATTLALVFLETVCVSQKNEWELVAFKAEGWLQGQPLPSGSVYETVEYACKQENVTFCFSDILLVVYRYPKYARTLCETVITRLPTTKYPFSMVF